MARKSSIDECLLPEDKAELSRRIAGGRMTIDDLVQWLDALGYTISRSAVGRYKKREDIVGEKLRQSREITEALSKQLGDSMEDGEQARFLTEVTRSLVFDFQMKALEHGVEFSAGDFFFLAKAQKELMQTMRLSQDFETKITERVRQEESRKTVEAVEAVSRKQGLSPDVQRAVEELLGFKRDV